MRNADDWINYWIAQEMNLGNGIEETEWQPLKNISQVFEIIDIMEEIDWIWELKRKENGQYCFTLIDSSGDSYKNEKIVGQALTKERAVCLTVLVAFLLDSQIKELSEKDGIDFSSVVIEHNLF